MSYRVVSVQDLPEEVLAGIYGYSKPTFGWVLLDGDEYLGDDICEPEDALLVRDFAWVLTALQAERERGEKARATATAAALEAACRAMCGGCRAMVEPGDWRSWRGYGPAVLVGNEWVHISAAVGARGVCGAARIRCLMAQPEPPAVQP